MRAGLGFVISFCIPPGVFIFVFHVIYGNFQRVNFIHQLVEVNRLFRPVAITIVVFM